MEKLNNIMRTIILCILTMSSIVFQAQNREPEAKALLDQVSAKVNSYENMVLDFKYVLDNSEENIHQETRGDVTLVGDNYLLNILGITRIFDGDKLITISPEDEEVTISTQNTTEGNTITPSQLLSFMKKAIITKWILFKTYEAVKFNILN